MHSPVGCPLKISVGRIDAFTDVGFPLKICGPDCASGGGDSQRLLRGTDSCGRVAVFLAVALELVVSLVATLAVPFPLRPADGERDFALMAFSRVPPLGVKRLDCPDLDKFRFPLPVLGDRPFDSECFHLQFLGEFM